MRAHACRGRLLLGSNSWGQIGNGVTGGSYLVPTAVSGSYTFANISVGTNSACGVTTAGAGYCWGQNSNGQVGDGSTSNRNVPTSVSGGYTFVSVAAGNNYSCGTVTSGATYCWGDNSDDRLGSATIPVNSSPLLVSGSLSFASISIGGQLACGVTTTGGGYCWGQNANGEIGDNTTTNRWVPTAVNGSYTWSMISAGSNFACGITTSNVAYCWGSNGNGQLGDGTNNQRNIPTAVSTASNPTNYSYISSGYQTTCAITTSNAAYCWGSNSNGQFGNGGTTSSTTPTAVSNGLLFSNISVPTIGATTCGVTTTNVGYCWGQNSSGQLGIGNSTQQTTPQGVSGSLSFSYIGVGGFGATEAQTCGVTTAGAGYCWGSDAQGELGAGTTTSYNTPHAITGSLTLGTSTSSISGGSWNSCGVTSGNAAYCWGYNGSGRLGDGTTLTRTSPTAVAGGLSFSSVSAGQYATCGLTTSHAAYCWGGNGYGNLGTGTAMTMISTPQFVDNAPVATSIAQTKTNSSVISNGGWTNQTSVLISATLTDQDTEMSDTVKWCVEVEPVGTIFNNTGTCSSANASGSSITYTASGLTDGTQYHWQYRTEDSETGYSQWASFNSGNMAFEVDTSAPNAGSVSLTTTTSLSAVTGTISGFSDTSSGVSSGIASYSYALGTTAGGTDVVGWTSNGASTSISISSLSLRTSQPYYLSVTATDNATNTSSVATSPVKQVVPSASFSSTQPSSIVVNQGGTASATFTVTTSTNAYGGYQIYAVMPSALTYQSSTISNFSGGTWSSPNALSAGTGFGYTSSDTSVSGSNRFQAATCPGGVAKTGVGCYAAFNTASPGDVVADDLGPVTGSAITNETFTITITVSAPSNQAAGTYVSQIRLAPVFTY